MPGAWSGESIGAGFIGDGISGPLQRDDGLSVGKCERAGSNPGPRLAATVIPAAGAPVVSFTAPWMAPFCSGLSGCAARTPERSKSATRQRIFDYYRLP